jgi:hypothetical protein
MFWRSVAIQPTRLMWKCSVIVVGKGKELDNVNLGAARALNQVDF